MKPRTATKLLLSVVAAAGLLVATSPEAFAYSFEWNEAVDDGTGPGDYDTDVTCINSVGADVCFMPWGDKIWVYDTQADGASAVARWYTDYGRWGTCRNAHGAGEWAFCNKDFAEGHTIYFRATQYDAGKDDYVGDESSLQHSGT
ncbi:hypothetical protein ACFV3F_44030 [Streptomyces sp. NPDC059717]|uniref:hypothetical protein n=1 Tax=Streptomyces sp. NPDC059717 TaxID=3346922 RepID=UPI0036C51A41